jgi:hypothetical protein
VKRKANGDKDDSEGYCLRQIWCSAIWQY